jgi:hypothetical protein
MYESVGYSTYEESDAFANGIEAQIPVEGTIPRGWVPYEYLDTNEGYESTVAAPAAIQCWGALSSNRQGLAGRMGAVGG